MDQGCGLHNVAIDPAKFCKACGSFGYSRCNSKLCLKPRPLTEKEKAIMAAKDQGAEMTLFTRKQYLSNAIHPNVPSKGNFLCYILMD